MNRAVMTFLALSACAFVSVGCAVNPPLAATTVARVPMSYTRSYGAPREQTFRATMKALESLGHKVAVADPVRGALETTRQVHGLARGGARHGGEVALASHAFVVSVREKEPGHSVVTGYVRTFAGERETTAIGKPSEPIIDELWTRLFAEVASDLK